MGLHLTNALEQWSGKHLLPVDRGLALSSVEGPFAPSRSPMGSWSSTQTREDRTRFVPSSVSDTGRIAETWSSTRERDDRARFATVDICTGTLTPEPWSSVQLHDDRVRIAGAPGRKGRGAYGAVAVATATLALLVAAPAAWADPGSSGSTPAASGTTPTDQAQGSGTPDATVPASGQQSSVAAGTSVTPAADGQTSGSTDASSSDPTPAADITVPEPPASSGSAQSATASAGSDQHGAQNTNVGVRTGQGGDDGAVIQGNSDAATASSSTSGGTAPVADGTSSNAEATATQTAAGNTNVAIRVASPGNVGPTTQSNAAQASAGGSGNANASATQTSPANVNVVVRVGSPGDNAPVDQQNTVTATAGPDTPAPVSAGGGATTGQTDQSVPTTGDATGANDSTTDQEIVQEQGGSAPQVGESPELEAGTVDEQPTGTATATQTGASNLNVSVRIGSPGVDGRVQQVNTATATGSGPDLGVVAVEGGTNTSVSIVVPGDVSAPGSTWTWTWTWTTAGTPIGGAAGDVAPTDGPDWTWAWTTAEQAGAATTTGSTATGPTGTFTWNWTWTKPDGTTSTWTWQQACSCNWTWTWTWDWSAGAPASTPAPAAEGAVEQPAGTVPAPTTTYATGDVTQQNSAAANAVAGAELLTSRVADEQPYAGDGYVSQIIDTEQQATATATVVMTDPLNLGVGFGVGSGDLSQANTLEADALAFDHLDATQVVVQQQTQSATVSQTVSAGNWATGGQLAVATADAGSADTVNRSVGWAPGGNSAHLDDVAQWNGGASSATAINWESSVQWIQQFVSAGQATTQEADAANSLVTIQSAVALATTWQAQLSNLNDVLVPTGSRATNPSLSQSNVATASAVAANVDGTQQWISQFQSGESDDEGSLAVNEATTTQSGLEGMTAQQLDLVNRSGWRGVEPPPAAPPVPAPATAPPVGTDVVEQDVVVMAPAELVTTLPPAPRPRLHRLHPRAEISIVTAAAPGESAAHATCVADCAPAVPDADGETAAQVVRLSATRVAPLDRPRHHAEASTAPSGKNTMPDGGFGSGSSGSAPPSGSGPVAFATRAYTFATPAHLGSHVPAPALGPPVATADPFERPG